MRWERTLHIQKLNLHIFRRAKQTPAQLAHASCECLAIVDEGIVAVCEREPEGGLGGDFAVAWGFLVGVHVDVGGGFGAIL